MEAINILIIFVVILSALLFVSYLFCCYRNTEFTCYRESYWRCICNKNNKENRYSHQAEYFNENNSDQNFKGVNDQNNQLPIAYVQPSAPQIQVVEATSV